MCPVHWCEESIMTVTPSDALNTALYKLTGYRLTQAAPHALTDTGVGVPWLRSYLYLADLLDGAPDGGAIVECGVATGGTLAMLVDLSQLRRVAMGRDGNVYGFDSWAGHMPSPTVADFDGSGDNKASWYEPPKGGKEAVLANLKNWGYESRHVTLVQGWFEDTMDQLPDRISFLHIDADLYESYRTVLRSATPKLVPGAIIALDEYERPKEWPGARRAVDEWLAENPEGYEITQHPHGKFYITCGRELVPGDVPEDASERAGLTRLPSGAG